MRSDGHSSLLLFRLLMLGLGKHLEHQKSQHNTDMGLVPTFGFERGEVLSSTERYTKVMVRAIGSNKS